MATPHAIEQRRVQFDLLPARLAEFDQLMIFCDLKTRKEMFDNAMTLFEWAVHEVMNGNEISSYNRKIDHVEVVRFPVLENAARRAKSLQVVKVEEQPAESDPPQLSAVPRTLKPLSEPAESPTTHELKEVEC
jgi:hypothetical protein